MFRRIATAVVALAAAALLGLLVYESRPLPHGLHAGHHALHGELQRVVDDAATLQTELAFYRQQLQRPGETARGLTDRLAEAPERLAVLRERAGHTDTQLDRQLLALNRDLELTASQAGQLLDQLTRFTDDVHGLRDEGPSLVQQLQDAGERDAATTAFSLVAAALEHARQSGTEDQADGIRRRAASLGRDLDMMASPPEGMQLLLDRARSVITLRDAVDRGLANFSSEPVARSAATVATREQALYSQTLLAADQSRTLLSIYAVALLLGAGAIAVRLHQSYREINAANAHLEQRVAERTEEVSRAYRDLKESQVQLVQAEKMSSLGQLVAGISHEINTPLLYLNNNATLIRERLDAVAQFVERAGAAFAQRRSGDESAEAFRDRFTRSLREARDTLVKEEIADGVMEAQSLLEDSIEGLAELSNMAQSLKDFSRLDRAPVDSFDVNRGLERTLLIARNALKHKVEVHTELGELPAVTCSPSQINQVFLNLITNAAQAIEDNGEIRISTSADEDGRHVRVRIADNGCGIAPENMARIRDPFFTTKEVGAGTGLGLAIVDEIVRAHHGELQIESEVGRGSVFTLVLPTTAPVGHGQQDAPDAETAAEPLPLSAAG